MTTSIRSICVLLTIFVNLIFPNNDVKLSNYFIGEFNAIAETVPLPYPPNYCLKLGLIGSYAIFECSLDETTITKKTYASTDEGCIGEETEDRQIYSHDSNIEHGDLGDFNCAGKDNAMSYIAYLGSCKNDPIGVAWLATDICYKFLNSTNITGKGNLDNYKNVPADQLYALTQRNTCEGCELILDTYVGDNCQNSDKPLSRFIADPGCEFFFEKSGFKVYAAAIACVKDGVDQFDYLTENDTCEYIPETTDTDNAIMLKYIGAILIILIYIPHF